MSRSAEMNREQREQSEKKIFAAAMELFCEKGFHATKTSEIVKRAGISQGLLYHYFPDKETLFQRCLERCIERAGVYVKELLKEAKTPKDKIISFTEEILCKIAENDVFLYQFMIFIHMSLEPGNKDMMDRYDKIPCRDTAILIAEAQRNGDAVEGDPIVLSTLYWAAIKGICINKMSKNMEYKMPEPQMLYHMLLR